MGEMADLALDQILDLIEEWDETNEDPIQEDGTPSFHPFWGDNKPFAIFTGEGNCPQCGHGTHLVEGRFGKFYGCNQFPKCKGSRSYVSKSD